MSFDRLSLGLGTAGQAVVKSDVSVGRLCCDGCDRNTAKKKNKNVRLSALNTAIQPG